MSLTETLDTIANAVAAEEDALAASCQHVRQCVYNIGAQYAAYLESSRHVGKGAFARLEAWTIDEPRITKYTGKAVYVPLAMHGVMDALIGMEMAISIPTDGAKPLAAVLKKHGPEALTKIVTELGTETPTAPQIRKAIAAWKLANGHAPAPRKVKSTYAKVADGWSELSLGDKRNVVSNWAGNAHTKAEQKAVMSVATTLINNWPGGPEAFGKVLHDLINNNNNGENT